MSQNVALSHLSAGEREAAFTLWTDLVMGSSVAVVEGARVQLVEAPSRIQQAIIHEIVQALRQGHDLQSLANPFAAEA